MIVFDVNRPFRNHTTLLCTAVMREILLENNAKINVKKRNGETPLLCAIFNERIDIVKLLMAAGADINAEYSIMRSTLMHDIYSKPWILQYLLSLDEPMTDVNILNKAGQNILHSNSSSRDRAYICVRSSRIILDAGIDVNAQDSEGRLVVIIVKSLLNIISSISSLNNKLSTGLTVCEGNRQAVEIGFDDSSKTRREELQKMKINKVSMTIRLKFAVLDQIINEIKLKTAYPLYGGMLFYKLSKVRRRIKYLEVVEKFVEGILWDLRLPATFIRELCFLNTQHFFIRSLGTFKNLPRKILKFRTRILKNKMLPNLSYKLACMEIPKISSKEINVTVVEKFLNQPGNNVNSIVYDQDRPFPNYTTLLCMAVKKKDEALIDYLIYRQANLDQDSAYGNENPLYLAALKGDTKLFKKLYHLGADINLSSLIRSSPLMIAARCGRLEIIKYLIKQGLDVNVTEPDCGSRLLHHAAASSNTELVEFLLENNAEIDAEKHYGETPLLCAISTEKINNVKLLMARGADINTLRSSNRRSTVMHDVHYRKSILKYLLSLDEPMTDVNILNNAKETILHYKLSSFYSCAETCSIILNAGVDVNARDSKGQLAVNCRTSSKHHTEHVIIERHIVKLISAGLTVCKGNRQAVEKAYDDFRKTCLEEIQKMKIDKVGLTIRLKFAGLDQVINEEKLNIAFPLYGGMIFYKLSKVQRRIKYLEEVEEFVEGILWDLGLPSIFIRELWSYFTNIQLKKLVLINIQNKVMAGVSIGLANTKIPKVRGKKINVTVVEELLNQPDNNVDMIIFDLDAKFYYYTTLLCMAVRNGDEELIDYLINRKADVNKSLPPENENPLLIAAGKGNTEVFKKLYHLGADINLSSSKDLSTLTIAALCGHHGIIKFLIEQGLDVNVTEPDHGFRLLHHAATSSNTELVELLLENNAEIDAKHHNGITPLFYAVTFGRINTVKLLMARGANINNAQGSLSKSTLIHVVHYKKSILKYLLSLDEPVTDVNILNKAGQTILHYKLSTHILNDTGDESCSIILDAGVDVNAQDSKGQLAVNCKTFFRDTTKNTILKRHIVKLISAGLAVCEGNRQAVEIGFDDLRETCLEELQKMKINKVGVSNITFFHVLHMTFHKLAIRLKFAGLDQVINEEKLKTAYPLYGGMLFYKLSKVQRRIKYLEEVEEYFEGILWNLGLPSHFIRELWSYFTNIELKKLILHENNNFIKLL
ncbi:Similar to RF_0381: Putative ankyrin repeat protein RF_0381 (Rickettsia felis (strain ATCC VR-1525 / URRWXCal2)) [Cotesia congregata]|uniref:Similar to RF_0381: Putative ankyrin repeat protein RF_0381 (Rickettsia felis (Strain ATCC VR-1525 / URRWXCal2)) n=1 Tax=Cotesia congregata TaxID=51543 RepID=A0A8J2HCL3_COTCN|nr:Similar to RF_0381: Putative ankyrin repeat protein RF_0381 (Rickettsia felis (strain ATCC VR-1525 / URRWXCal2)) [Cotesia congregata]